MSQNKQINNVFEAILEYGHDEDFVPAEDECFIPTDAPAGSEAKIEALRNRPTSGRSVVVKLLRALLDLTSPTGVLLRYTIIIYSILFAYLNFHESDYHQRILNQN